MNNIKPKLSVVLATRNEEENIGYCLETVKDIADEVIVVDEKSKDKTSEIAKKYGAKVFEVRHEPIFHKNKQKALDLAGGDWVLQLDADERVTPSLAEEIKTVINLTYDEIKNRKFIDRNKYNLFKRYEKLIRKRDISLDKKSGEIVAFFIPRINIFLGKPLRYAGVYPDGVIRLVKKGKAFFPSETVHELMKIDGEIAWLENDLEHYDSPTFKRYLERANRYTDLTANEYKQKKIPVNSWNLFKYSFVIPMIYFLKLYFRHKGFLDGMRGFIWSSFSAFHFPISYFKYWQMMRV